MSAHSFTVESTAFLEARAFEGSGRGVVLTESIPALTLRVRAEYVEMPCLRLSVLQAARLFGVAPEVARSVLDHLRRASVLTCSDRGTYSLSR